MLRSPGRLADVRRWRSETGSLAGKIDKPREVARLEK
jgi:hypothetical protein